MMKIIPAIDLLDGRCVRLTEGDFGRVTRYHYDPVEMVLSFYEAGFHDIHMVDLDGAKSKRIVNLPVLESVVAAAPVQIEWGGGITSSQDIETLLETGAARVIVGSMAATHADQVKEWLNGFGSGKIIIGTDVKNDHIAVHGWKETVAWKLHDFIDFWLKNGARNFLCTDIARDGLLSGVSVGMYRTLKKLFPDAFIIASGGISSMNDMMELRNIGVDAVVIGKALYEKTLTMEELQRFMQC